MAEAQKESLFVWQTLGPDGRWGQILAHSAFIGNIPLSFRSADKAEAARSFAVHHRSLTGEQVRLMRYDEADLMETLP